MLKKELDPAEEKIRKDAVTAREYIQLLPNYTPFRICDLVKELGIELKEEDIWKFVYTFDYGPLHGMPDYAYHAFADYGISRKEYIMDTYVCRRDMIREFKLKEVKNKTTIRSVTFADCNEIQIRNYDDLGLIDGKIYPITHKDRCSLMSLMDRWYRELKKGFEATDDDNQNDPGSMKEQDPNQLVWELEFKFGIIDFFNSRCNHAEEVLEIIRSLHPDMEQIFRYNSKSTIS